MPAKKTPAKKTPPHKRSARPELWIHSRDLSRFSRVNSRFGFWLLNPELITLPGITDQGNPNDDGYSLSRKQILSLGRRFVALGERMVKRSSNPKGAPQKWKHESRLFAEALKTPGISANAAWTQVYEDRKVKARLNKLSTREKADEKIRMRQAVRKRLKLMLRAD